MKTIKEMRIALGLTKVAFSKKLNIPLRTLEDWEAGRKKPSDYLVELIAYRLDAELQKVEPADKKI